MFKQSNKVWMVLAALLLCVNVFIGCDKDDEDKALEINGTWTSAFGGNEVISNESWVFSWGMSGAIIEYNNDNNTLYIQNPANDEYNPSKFSKIVWTEIAENSFYYCTLAVGSETLDDAKNDTTAYDSSDPDNSGCNGWSWTKLTKAE